MTMKIAFITGGTKGIGLAVAKKLQKSGYTPVINYFSDEATAKKVEKEYGFLTVKADVADEKQISGATEYVVSKFGKIDVLVNSAGIAPKQSVLLDVDGDVIKRTIDVNLAGTVNATKAVFAYMLKNRSGVIINVSSAYGERGGACEAVYSATKGGINAFTKSFALEASAANVRVNAVAPGFIDTDMNAHIGEEDRLDFYKDLPIKRIGTPDDVADAVAFLIEATYITGAIIPVDGGMNL